MDWTQPGTLIKLLYPEAIWRIPNQEHAIFLTFDDGPEPTVTPWVLDLLEQYKVKASFFCIGKNVLKHQALYQRLIQAGHAIGNHSFEHEKGWITPYSAYLKSVEDCQHLVHSHLFRPPYGKLSYKQFFALRKKYKIVMWDVLTYDYNQAITAKDSLAKSLKKTRNGSIVVFHDSIKAFSKLKEMLPNYIEQCLAKGFVFKTLK